MACFNVKRIRKKGDDKLVIRSGWPTFVIEGRNDQQECRVLERSHKPLLFAFRIIYLSDYVWSDLGVA